MSAAVSVVTATAGTVASDTPSSTNRAGCIRSVRGAGVVSSAQFGCNTAPAIIRYVTGYSQSRRVRSNDDTNGRYE